jgi:hypothetical protein
MGRPRVTRVRRLACVWLVVPLLAGCTSLATGARQDFARRVTCPADKVSVVRRPDVPPHTFYSFFVNESSPPADVAADPSRLSLWQQERDKKIRDADAKCGDGGMCDVFEVAGCGQRQVVYCYHPVAPMEGGGEGNSLSQVECQTQPAANQTSVAIVGANVSVVGGLVRLAHRPMHAAHDQSHQLHQGREQQALLVLPRGALAKQSVQRLRLQSTLHQGARHDGDRAALGELLEHLRQNHLLPLHYLPRHGQAPRARQRRSISHSGKWIRWTYTRSTLKGVGRSRLKEARRTSHMRP